MIMTISDFAVSNGQLQDIQPMKTALLFPKFVLNRCSCHFNLIWSINIVNRNDFIYFDQDAFFYAFSSKKESISYHPAL